LFSEQPTQWWGPERISPHLVGESKERGSRRIVKRNLRHRITCRIARSRSSVQKKKKTIGDEWGTKNVQTAVREGHTGLSRKDGTREKIFVRNSRQRGGWGLGGGIKRELHLRSSLLGSNQWRTRGGGFGRRQK